MFTCFIDMCFTDIFNVLLLLPRVTCFLFVLPDLTWIQVRSAEEAWRILRAGCHNQSFASTYLNQNSSRR